VEECRRGEWRIGGVKKRISGEVKERMNDVDKWKSGRADK
jgi:hypothetical protein